MNQDLTAEKLPIEVGDADQEKQNPSTTTTNTIKMETKLELFLDAEKLRCLNSKEGLTTTITVIT